MVAVILAAGISSRLRPLTDALPKSLLSVAGKPLLQRTLEALAGNGIDRCVIVTGYQAPMIETFAESLRSSLQVSFVHNRSYATTNNNYSLWLTRAAVLGEELLLLDADILFAPGILTRLLESSHPDALVMRRTQHAGPEEIKIELDAVGRVRSIGKDIGQHSANGESLGIEKFSRTTTAHLFRVLERRKDRYEFYEASFQEMIEQGVALYVVESGSDPCIEIDTPDDLLAAELLAKTTLQ
jgi:choline kinase